MPAENLLLGATGRLGRMLHGVLADDPAWAFQSRGPHAGHVQWDPLSKAPLPMRPKSIASFLGAIPGRQAELGLNSALAIAALEAAIACGAQRVLLASSSAVYGIGRDLVEQSPLVPVNAYGTAKCEMEHIAQRYADKLSICCLRIGNVCGADALMENARHATPAEPLKITQFPDGSGPIRSYIGPNALARVVRALIRCPSPLPPALNIGATPPLAMADLATAAQAPWEWVPANPNNHQYITIDCTALSQVPGMPSIPAQAAAMLGECRWKVPA